MAPECLARRLALPMFGFLIVFLNCFLGITHSLLVYERNDLLKIKNFVEQCAEYCCDEPNKPCPTYLADIPDYLLRVRALLPERRKRRGVRSGRLVRLKSWLVLCPELQQCPWNIPQDYEACYRRFARCKLVTAAAWLLPVHGVWGDVGSVRLSQSRLRRLGGVNPANLQPLSRAAPAADVIQTPLKCAILNARSVVNKTFIIQDFFSSHSLELLFLTETWIKPGESAAFSELLPPGCVFIDTPRSTGRGGGVAVVFKNSVSYKPLTIDSCASFEMSCFELRHNEPVFCAVIYRPPKYNNDFISDFSNFIAPILTKYDKILLVGDLNLHVCCPSTPMAKDFIELIDGFNLVQHVNRPTQKHGHTLDLVMSCNLPINNIVVGDAIIADHCPVLFDFVLSDHSKPATSMRHCRVLNPDTAAAFSSLFTAKVPVYLGDARDTACLDSEESMNSFITTIMDAVAPQKAVRPKPNQHRGLMTPLVRPGGNVGRQKGSGTMIIYYKCPMRF